MIEISSLLFLMLYNMILNKVFVSHIYFDVSNLL